MSLNFGNYQPETFGWTKTNGDNDQFWYEGVEIAGGINKAPGYRTLVTLMLDALVPHIPGGLVAGWCWGGDTSDSVDDSFHKYAIAIDLNAPANPMSSTSPKFGQLSVLPADTGDIIRPFGFEWGGNWDASTPPDYMHIEFAGSPDEIPVLMAQHTAATTVPAAPPVVSPAPIPAPVPAPPHPLEHLMSMPDAPATWSDALKEIATAVCDEMAQLQQHEERNPGGTIAGIEDANNAVNHSENWDHTPGIVTQLSPAAADIAARRGETAGVTH